MSEDDIPVAVRSEKIRVCGVEIDVHVLEDGRRVIGAEALDRLFDALGFVVDDEDRSDCAARAESAKGRRNA